MVVDDQGTALVLQVVVIGNRRGGAGHIPHIAAEDFAARHGVAIGRLGHRMLLRAAVTTVRTVIVVGGVGIIGVGRGRIVHDRRSVRLGVGIRGLHSRRIEAAIGHFVGHVVDLGRGVAFTADIDGVVRRVDGAGCDNGVGRGRLGRVGAQIALIGDEGAVIADGPGRDIDGRAQGQILGAGIGTVDFGDGANGAADDLGRMQGGIDVLIAAHHGIAGGSALRLGQAVVFDNIQGLDRRHGADLVLIVVDGQARHRGVRDLLGVSSVSRQQQRGRRHEYGGQTCCRHPASEWGPRA